MQIIIEFKGENITLPFSYNHYIQGMIYNALSCSPDYADFLHNHGYKADGHVFRLFTFGSLKGKYTTKDKSIIFEDSCSLEIRSVDMHFITICAVCFAEGHEFSLGGNRLYVSSCRLKDNRITNEKIRIAMCTPVVARRVSDGTSEYFSPSDSDFAECIEMNFESKYRAVFQSEPLCEINVSEPSGLRKIVTNYKGIWINGYLGKMTLSSSAECLDLLYNTGIGSKNAQGFGMFDAL